MKSDLTLLSCSEFSERLASKSPVPGGGGAAALLGALGTALGAMAGNLTVGKKKYAAYEDDLRRLLAQAEALRLRFLALIDEDAEAFEPLSRAYSLPKDDPRSAEALTEATLRACAAPFAMMEGCCEAVRLLEELRGKCSALMLSDVGCGAAALRAALEAAWLNVLVNTRSLPHNSEALETERRAEALLREYLPRAQRISDSVAEALRRTDNG